MLSTLRVCVECCCNFSFVFIFTSTLLSSAFCHGLMPSIIGCSSSSTSFSVVFSIHYFLCCKIYILQFLSIIFSVKFSGGVTSPPLRPLSYSVTYFICLPFYVLSFSFLLLWPQRCPSQKKGISFKIEKVYLYFSQSFPFNSFRVEFSFSSLNDTQICILRDNLQ